jgi:vacuolar-type H+-ATPase subunit H
MAVPGAAGIAGVPANREAVLREELAPIFAALREAEQNAENVVARARAQGDAQRVHATQEGQRILEEARDLEPSERVTAAEAVASSAQSDATAIQASANEEAERIARLAAKRIPTMAKELAARVMSTGNLAETTK